MKLPHQQVKHGHFCDVSLHMTAHVVEMVYTSRYRVGRSGEHVPKSAGFSCSSGDRISFNALGKRKEILIPSVLHRPVGVAAPSGGEQTKGCLKVSASLKK